MAENRRGLGRGLSALLGEAEEITHAGDPAVVPDAQVHEVAPVQQLEHGLQVVESVRPPAGDPQEQIELGRRRERGRAHGPPHASTTSRTLAPSVSANTRRGRGGVAASHSR